MVSESNKIGLLPAILMVAGNMMGSGVFMLPANLAGIGSIAIIGWLITVVGAIALAFCNFNAIIIAFFVCEIFGNRDNFITVIIIRFIGKF